MSFQRRRLSSNVSYKVPGDPAWDAGCIAFNQAALLVSICLGSRWSRKCSPLVILRGTHEKGRNPSLLLLAISTARNRVCSLTAEAVAIDTAGRHLFASLSHGARVHTCIYLYIGKLPYGTGITLTACGIAEHETSQPTAAAFQSSYDVGATRFLPLFPQLARRRIHHYGLDCECY